MEWKKSADYLSDIEKVYFGGASKSNAGFVGHSYIAKYDYADQVAVSNLIKILKENEYTKINIDENCVVGWATAYFHMVVKARNSHKNLAFFDFQNGKI